MKIFEQIPSQNNPNPEDVKENNKEEENTAEKAIGKIDESFLDLLDQVKDAPELKKKALETFIREFGEIAGQIKKVKDIKQIQELKKLMLKNWEELKEIAKGDPVLLSAIQEWGQKFVDQKVVYYELVGDIKDELMEKAERTREIHDEIITIDLPSIMSRSRYRGLSIDHPLASRNIRDPNYIEDIIEENFSTSLDTFLQQLNNPESFYQSDSLKIEEADKFLFKLNSLIVKIEKRRQEDLKNLKKRIQLMEEKRDINELEELEKLGVDIKELIAKKTELSKSIREISSVFKLLKKARDTHFLSLYNDGGQQRKAA